MGTNALKVSPAQPDFNTFLGTGGLLTGNFYWSEEVFMDRRRKRHWRRLRTWDWVMGIRLIILILNRLL